MGGRQPAEDMSKTFFGYNTSKGKDNSEKKETPKARRKRRKIKYVFSNSVFILEDDGKI